MKKLSVFTISFLLAGTLFINDIYSYSFTKLEGGTQQLSSFQGKKILIITLPVQQNAAADSLLYALDTLGAAHTATLKIIGVPSFEDGYNPSDKAPLMQWYRSKLGSHIVIADGMYTRRTSGAQQHSLFNWLTDDTQNERFNMDVTGPGFKFFISTAGELYGVLQPQTKVSSAAVQRTLAIQ